MLSELDFPVRPELGDQELVRRFKTYRREDTAAASVDFEISAPTAWIVADCSENTLSSDQTPGFSVHDISRKAEITVFESAYSRDVNPADWLEIAWEQVSGKILKRRTRWTPSGILAELLVHHVGRSGPRICYSTIGKQGRHMFRIEASAAEDVYPEVAQDLFFAATSFRLLHPTGESVAEPLVRSSHDSPVHFAFQYLASWEMETRAVPNVPCTLLLTSRHNGVEAGRITLQVRMPAPEVTPYRLAREYAEGLMSNGIHVSGAPVLPVSPTPTCTAAALYAPAARWNGHEFDTPLLVLQHPYAMIALSLLGPTRKESPEWWAINKRAFEIVRDSLTLGEPTASSPGASPPSVPTDNPQSSGAHPPGNGPRLLDAGSY